MYIHIGTVNKLPTCQSCKNYQQDYRFLLLYQYPKKLMMFHIQKKIPVTYFTTLSNPNAYTEYHSIVGTMGFKKT